MKPPRGLKWLTGALPALPTAGESPVGTEADPFRALMEQSLAQRKGVIFLVAGQQMAGVVVRITADHVFARNQAQGLVVIRRDRIDGVAGHLETGFSGLG